MRRLRLLLVAFGLTLVHAVPVTSVDAQPGDWGVKRDPFDKAVVARWKDVLSRNPHDVGALAKLFGMYRQYRTPDLLKEELQKALDKAPGNAALMIVLGRLHRMTGDDPRALEMFRRAVAAKPGDAQVSLLIGEIERAAGNTKEARAAYDLALQQATAKDMKKKALRALADLALAGNDIDAANGYFKSFLELDPKNAQLWIERGDAMLAAKKLDIALESYEAAEKLLGGDPARKIEVISRRGQALEEQGKHELAVAEYRRAIQAAPKGYYLEVELTTRIIDLYRKKSALPALLAEYEKAWPEGSRGHFEWDTLGRLYGETGAQGKAIAALKRAVAKAPHELETQRRLIALLESSGNDAEALTQYEAVVRVAPGDARFQLELAERYMRRGQDKKALETLARLRARFPNDAGVLGALAEHYQKFGKDDLAIAEYERLAKLEPDDPAHLVTLGERYWIKGDTASKQRALAVWKRLVTSGKASGFAKLGEVMAEHGFKAEALANYDKAIKVDDKNPEFYKGRAGVYESDKKYKEAVADWEKVLALTGAKPTDRLARKDARRHLVALVVRWGAPEAQRRRDWEGKFASGDVEAGYFLVEYYGKRPQKGEPLGTLEKLRAKVPDDHEVLLDLVKQYRIARNYDAAVKELLALAAVAPSREREVYQQISEIMTEARKDDEAIQWAQKALAKSPSDPTAYERLGERYVEMQRFPQAIAAYEKTIALDPRNSKAHFALAQLHVHGGEPLKATALLRNMIRTAPNEDVVARAAREAIDLEEMTDSLGELERVLQPLSRMMSHKPVYRRVLVDLYLRYVPRLVDRERHGTSEVKAAARAELTRIGGHGLQPLLEALRDEKDVSQQRVAVAVLGHLGNKGAAQPLVRMAKHETPKDAPRHLGTLTEAVDREVRVAALVAAGRLGDASVLSEVLPLAEHDEVAMREAAVFTLGRARDRRAVPALLAALADRRGSVQALACLGLGQSDDPRGGPAMIAALSDARRDDATRAACAYAIGARKLTSALPALLGALGDNRGDAQRVAAWALGQIGDPKALGPLIRAYFSRSGRSDTEMIWAIGRTSGAGLAPASLSSWGDYPQRGDKYHVVEAIARLPGDLPSPPISSKLVIDHASEIARGLVDALAEHRDVVVSVLADLDGSPTRLGLGALTPATEDGPIAPAIATIAAALAPALAPHVVSDDPKVRALAISVLAKIDGGKQRADAAIAKALVDPSDHVRAAAMNAVAVLGQRRGTAPADLVTTLTSTLAKGTWSDRRGAALALGRLGPGSDPTALLSAAGDPSSFVREAVATSLGGIGGTSVIEPLLKLSRDDIPQVRAAAARALAVHPDPRAVRRRAELARDPDEQVRASVAGGR